MHPRRYIVWIVTKTLNLIESHRWKYMDQSKDTEDSEHDKRFGQLKIERRLKSLT
jgi:hypothetical protein